MRTRYFGVLAVLCMLTFAGAAHAQQQLFFDGFESGGWTVGGWMTSGVTIEANYVYAGVYATNFNLTDSLIKPLDTTGFENITLSYYRRTRNFDLTGDNWYVEYTTNYGQSWTQLERVTNNQSYALKQYVLPSAAANNSLFGVRFRTSCGSSDHAYLDNVTITGTSMGVPRTLTVNVAGSGSVAQNPAPPYVNGQTVTLTANPASGWVFSQWSGDLTGTENPKSILMDANKTVTATFVEAPQVSLTVNIIGQGTYSVDPPGPWIAGTTVKVSFSPSTGNQFITKPDVPTVDTNDPNHGWAFDHWSYGATTPQFGNLALANPATLTLNSNTTIYATFLNNGTAAHLTATQESQLMDISRNIWSGWNEMTQTQANELFVKAELALAEYRNKTERYGQAASIWFTNFDRTEGGHVYDYCGEGMTWSGMHLAALAMKHAVMPSDQQTLDDIQRVLDAMDRNTTIAGNGYCIRFSAPTNDPAWQWYYQADNGGAYTGQAPYTDYTYIATTTRDVHTGYFAGLAAVLTYCADVPALYGQAATIVERVVDRLILDSWRLKDGHCSLTCEFNNTILQQLQKRCAYKANPVKYASFATDIANYTLDIGTQKTMFDSEYWVDWMNWGRAMGIIDLETNPTKRQQFMAHIKSKYDTVFTYQNVMNIAVANYYDPGTMPAWGHAQAQGLLLAYPDGIKWLRKVDLFQDNRFTTRDATYVNQAALPHQRVRADWDPQRSPAKAQGGELNYAYQYTNIDLYFAYWMLRLSGDIPAPQ